MMHPHLRSRLEPIVERAKQHRHRLIQARAIAAAAIAGLIGFAIAPLIGWVAAAIVGFAALVWALIHIFSDPIDYHALAQRIEQAHPDLRALLLTAVEQESRGDEPLTYHQQRVIDEAVAHAEKHQWIASVSDRDLRVARFARGVALGLLGIMFIALFSPLWSSTASTQTQANNATPATHADTTAQYNVDVQPGNVEIERGQRLPILATFTGPLPPEVELLVGPDEENLKPMAMQRNLEDPVFGLTLPPVEAYSVYRVRFGEQQSVTYTIATFEHPTLSQADATLSPPAKFDVKPQIVRDTRAVSLIEGWSVKLDMQLNKPVAKAQWIERDAEGEVINTTDLKPAGDDPTRYTLDWRPPGDQRFEFHLTDAQGRTNKTPADFEVVMKPNAPPQFATRFPADDVAVSPVQELTVAAEAWDDAALSAWGVRYMLGGGDAQEITLGRGADTPHADLNHVLSMEQLGVKPDDLVAYAFWAEDVGPEGEPRRALSDMYLAEVRPFEKIYRQANASPKPPGDQQQQEPQIKLPELQKMIINATWRIKRKQDLASETSLTDEVTTVADSQRQAIDYAEQIREMITDVAALAALEEAMGHMNKAASHLDAAALTEALTAEQAAYAALLKLRARELNVVICPPGTAPPQPKLDLELDPDKDRKPYETERQAQLQQEQEQQQDLEQLDKLRELARRQSDLKERLNQLQAELALAKDQAERDRIERELKRLREQQQKLLREMDQTRQEMARRKSSQEMTQAQQQMAEARQAAQQAAEALGKGEAAQAAAAGGRAQEKIEEVREQFRRRTAERMRQQLEQMSEQAKDLTEAQKKLEAESQQAAQSGIGRPQDELAKQTAEQRQRAQQLAQQMQKLSEQAEKTEPLAARSLYDGLRSARIGGMDEAFEQAEREQRIGRTRQAAQSTETAGKGVRDIAQAVDEAAKRIMGDSNEAMRMARRELQDLAEQVEREFDDQQGREGEGRGQNEQQTARTDAAGDRNDRLGPLGDEGASQYGVGNSMDLWGRGRHRPLTGDDFRDWAERLRDVEHMLDDTELRNLAAQIRDDAWELRVEFKRHSAPPRWQVVKEQVTDPLNLLRDRIAEALARETGEDPLTPIDRDPAPPKYESLVQRYYKQLGAGE